MACASARVMGRAAPCRDHGHGWPVRACLLHLKQHPVCHSAAGPAVQNLAHVLVKARGFFGSGSAVWQGRQCANHLKQSVFPFVGDCLPGQFHKAGVRGIGVRQCTLCQAQGVNRQLFRHRERGSG